MCGEFSIQNMAGSVDDGLVRVFGLFAVVGVGLGVSAAVVIEGIGGAGENELAAGVIAAQALSIFFFVAPVVAAVAGVYAMIQFPSRKEAVQVGGAGSLFGFYLMFFAAFLVLSIAGGGPDPSFISGNVTGVVLASVPSALVGGVVALLD